MQEILLVLFHHMLFLCKKKRTLFQSRTQDCTPLTVHTRHCTLSNGSSWILSCQVMKVTPEDKHLLRYCGGRDTTETLTRSMSNHSRSTRTGNIGKQYRLSCTAHPQVAFHLIILPILQYMVLFLALKLRESEEYVSVSS